VYLVELLPRLGESRLALRGAPLWVVAGTLVRKPAVNEILREHEALFRFAEPEHREKVQRKCELEKGLKTRAFRDGLGPLHGHARTTYPSG